MKIKNYDEKKRRTRERRRIYREEKKKCYGVECEKARVTTNELWQVPRKASWPE